MDLDLDTTVTPSETPAAPATGDTSRWSTHRQAAVSPFDATRQAEPAQRAEALLSDTQAPEAVAEPQAVEAEPEAEAVEVTPDHSAVADALRAAVPGLALTEATPEAFATAYRDLYDERETYAQNLGVVAAAAERLPGLDVMIGKIGRGEDVIAALLEGIPELAEALDPEEGTAAYTKIQTAKREAALREQIRAEVLGPVEQERAARTQRWQADAARAYEAFAANVPESVAALGGIERFNEWYRSQNEPDATGRFRPDHFTSAARAFTYDHDVKAAKAEGVEAGRKAVLAEIRSGTLKADVGQKAGALGSAADAAARVPDLASGAGQTADLSQLPPDQQKQARFGQALASANGGGNPWSRHARA